MLQFLRAQRRCNQFLCLLLAGLMFAGPATPLAAQQATGAQPAAAPAHLSYVAPSACVIVAARPRQILTSPAFAMMPVEVIQAAGIQAVGIDPLTAEEVIASVSPPFQGPPEYAVYAAFSEAVDLPSGEMVEHTARDTLDGKPYLQSQQPMLPSFFQLDDRSLIVAPESALQRLVGNQRPIGLAEKFAAAADDDDLLMMVDVAALQPLIQAGLAQAAAEIPAELQSLLEIPGLMRRVELRVNLSQPGVSELVAEAAGPAAAERLVEIFDDANQFVMKQLQQNEEFQQMLQSEDPVEQAMGRYQQRMFGAWDEQVQLRTDGDRVIVFRTDGSEEDPMITVAVIGVLVALLLPAVQAAREAARRAQSINNMKNIMLALWNYETAHAAFPAHASFDDEGKPLLSWRVHILPYIEQQQLYERFHLDEPWDSAHNKALIPLMPEFYLDPSSPQFDTASGRTHYLGVLGEQFLFQGNDKQKKLREIRDGTSNTIAVVQVNDSRAAIWTKPDDWQYDAARPLDGLAPSFHPGIFLAAFCDGHIETLEQEMDPAALRAMLTIAGGEER